MFIQTVADCLALALLVFAIIGIRYQKNSPIRLRRIKTALYLRYGKWSSLPR